MKTGVFKYGNYGWLGEYRANEILSAVKKAGQDLDFDPTLTIDVFHACYLLNTSLTQNPDKTIIQIIQPILSDESLREITVADDLISRVFAAKFLLQLADKLRDIKKRAEENGDQQLASALGDFAKALQGKGSHGGSQRANQLKDVISEAVESAKQEARNYAEKAKAYAGLKAGVGHKASFGELLNLGDFAVDVKELFKMFKEISMDLARAKREAPRGLREGIAFGRDLTKLTPQALVLDEDTFWYRFATNTLPIFRTIISTAPNKVVILVDKSGSMVESNKTLWSRAVALVTAKQVKEAKVDAKLIFFDEYPFEPIDLKNFSKTLDALLRLRCEGGTSINRALKKADEFEDHRIILITDGKDKVSYKPSNKLTSVMVKGENETLKKISDEYLKVQPNVDGARKILSLVA